MWKIYILKTRDYTVRCIAAILYVCVNLPASVTLSLFLNAAQGWKFAADAMPSRG